MGRMNLPRLPQVAALSSENKNDKLALEWNEGRQQVLFHLKIRMINWHWSEMRGDGTLSCC